MRPWDRPFSNYFLILKQKTDLLHVMLTSNAQNCVFAQITVENKVGDIVTSFKALKHISYSLFFNVTNKCIHK